MIAASVVDTDPHPLFPVYSAGNLAEVAPERLSIMSWSLLGDPVERGCRAFVSRLWPASTWASGSAYVFVGYFSCRPYHNLSAFCHVARSLPGLTAEHVTRSYFEDAPPPDAAPGLRPGVRATVRATGRMLREIAALPTRIRGASGEVAMLEHQVTAALARDDALALGVAVEEARRVLELVWELHYTVTMALIPARAAQRRVGGWLHADWDELDPLLAGPGELIWPSARTAAEIDPGVASFLDLPFYEVADDHDPWRAYGRHQRLAADGTPAAAGGDDGELERVAWGMLRGPGRHVLPRLALFVSELLATREETKSLAMRCLHVHRRLMPRLADERGLDAADWPLLTVGELARGDQSAAELADLADLRRAACRRALAAGLPDVYEPARADGPAAADGARVARGVSPGRATGIVVDAAAAAARSDTPRILVCESADADIQPLLPYVQGVVSARGSLLSHIAILSREYRVPAVVGHELARVLTVGQRVAIDGTTGEVTLLGD